MSGDGEYLSITMLVRMSVHCYSLIKFYQRNENGEGRASDDDTSI